MSVYGKPARYMEDDLPITVECPGRPDLLNRGFGMAWVYLFVTGVLEIVWAFTMKKSEGFKLITPSVITIFAMLASFLLLSLSMRTLPLGTAYSVWTGVGAVGAFIVGIIFLGEALTPMRVFAASLIVAGIVLMNFSNAS